MRISHKTFVVTAALALINLISACGPKIVTVTTEKVVATVEVRYFCTTTNQVVADPSTCDGETKIVYVCQDGTQQDSPRCPVVCRDGNDYNEREQICEPAYVYVCPGGATASQAHLCPHVCNDGYDLNETSGQCERACPEGTMLKGNACVGIPTCDAGQYIDPATLTCVTPPNPPDCPTGQYVADGGACVTPPASEVIYVGEVDSDIPSTAEVTGGDVATFFRLSVKSGQRHVRVDSASYKAYAAVEQNGAAQPSTWVRSQNEVFPFYETCQLIENVQHGAYTGNVGVGTVPQSDDALFDFLPAVGEGTDIVVSLQCKTKAVTAPARLAVTLYAIGISDADTGEPLASHVVIGGINRDFGHQVRVVPAPIVTPPPPTLTVTLDSASPNAGIVLAGSQPYTSAFRLRAGDEPIEVRGLATPDCLTTGQVSAYDDCRNGVVGADSAVATVRLYDAQNALIGWGFLSNGRMVLTGTSLVVPANSSILVRIAPTLNDIGLGASSGDRIQLNLAGIQAIGVQSGAVATVLYTDGHGSFGQMAVAHPMTVRKTQPHVQLATGSPSGAAVPGMSEKLRFMISADSHGYVPWTGILFKITATDEANSGWLTAAHLAQEAKWSLYDRADPAADFTYGIYWPDANGQLVQNGVWLNADGLPAQPDEEVRYFYFGRPAPIIVGAGETRVYSLEMDDTGAANGGLGDDAVRIDIPDESEAAALGLHAFSWYDDAGTDLLDGTDVQSLPVRGGVLVN